MNCWSPANPLSQCHRIGQSVHNIHYVSPHIVPHVVAVANKMAYNRGKSKQAAGKRQTRDRSPTNLLEKPLSRINLESTGLPRAPQGRNAVNKYSRYSLTNSAQPSQQGGRSPQPERALASKRQGMIAPKGYTMRPIVPAEKAELLPVARAMNRDDFAPRVKKLFDPEREAAIDAIQSGVYIGWRCPSFKHDCIRVGKASKCFCGHLLREHARFTGDSVRVPCAAGRCECKAFAFTPSRAEEVGEWWLQRRVGYDPSSWRAKCKCKHTHEEHKPTGMRACRSRGCGCSHFISNFLCCACDRHWEEHETIFETEKMRKNGGLPYGEAYLPFHEFPELRDVVLTGREDDDSQYRALTSGPYAVPDSAPTELALRLKGQNPSNKPPFQWWISCLLRMDAKLTVPPIHPSPLPSSPRSLHIHPHTHPPLYPLECPCESKTLVSRRK